MSSLKSLIYRPLPHLKDNLLNLEALCELRHLSLREQTIIYTLIF